MSKNKPVLYSCVDDDSDVREICKSLIKEVGKSRLCIDPRAPSNWETETARIVSEARNLQKGCILDYRLDEKGAVNENGETDIPVGYTADSLIHELRRKSVQDGEDSFPVVLWSNATRLTEFHTLDPEYRFHYDLVLNKDQIPDNLLSSASKLVALGLGYRALRRSGKKIKSITAYLSHPESINLDTIDKFYGEIHKKHGYAYQAALFIIHDILNANGPLIEPSLVTAFCGLELGSCATVEKLAKSMARFRYKGVFAGGWELYWRQPLLAFLDTLAPSGVSWLRLSATERASLLKKHLKISRLRAAEPILKGYLTNYDCVCAVTKRPLAKKDGFSLLDDRQRIWKEPFYISGAELRKRYPDVGENFRLSEHENSRFRQIYDVR